MNGLNGINGRRVGVMMHLYANMTAFTFSRLRYVTLKGRSGCRWVYLLSFFAGTLHVKRSVSCA